MRPIHDLGSGKGDSRSRLAASAPPSQHTRARASPYTQSRCRLPPPPSQKRALSDCGPHRHAKRTRSLLCRGAHQGSVLRLLVPSLSGAPHSLALPCSPSLTCLQPRFLVHTRKATAVRWLPFAEIAWVYRATVTTVPPPSLLRHHSPPPPGLLLPHPTFSFSPPSRRGLLFVRPPHSPARGVLDVHQSGSHLKCLANAAFCFVLLCVWVSGLDFTLLFLCACVSRERCGTAWCRILSSQAFDHDWCYRVRKGAEATTKKQTRS